MSVEINQAVAQSGRRKFKSLRWWMLALFLLGVTVNYITRNSLGILAPELKTSLNMSTEQYAWWWRRSNWLTRCFSRSAAG